MRPLYSSVLPDSSEMYCSITVLSLLRFEGTTCQKTLFPKMSEEHHGMREIAVVGRRIIKNQNNLKVTRGETHH